MDEKQRPKIDDRLISADTASPETPETPLVYAITDLRQYVKPPMKEELGKSTGGLVNLDPKVVCTCVPVETCVCHQVTYDSEAGSDCGCTGNCPCTGTCSGNCYIYYRPY